MPDRNVPTLPPDVFASVVTALADTLIRDYRERWSRGGPDPNARPNPLAVADSPTWLKIADAAKRAQCGEEWWQDVTVPMLETARKRLRLLIKLIEKVHRKPVYTDFEDQMGAETAVPLPEFSSVADRTKFLAKARQFLKANESHITIARLRLNQPLTASDLAELERMMLDAGVGTPDDIAREKAKSQGLGVFIRSLVGLDREAAKQAFSQFLSGGTTTANQVEFVNLIVDHLTENGVMDPKRLYESPFTDVNPRGPEGVFSSVQVDQLVAVLTQIRERAAA